jgi:intein/homing endonuclease
MRRARGERLFDVTERAVEIAFKRDCRAAGIEPRGRRLRPHLLRHCLHPNTRVVVPEGVLPASMLYFRHSPVMAYDFNSYKIVEAEVSGKEMHIANRLISIWAGGRELVCTPEHRVFRIRGGAIEEVEASRLEVGDYIAGVRWIDVPNRRRVFDPRLWRLLGYVAGDGYVHETRTSRSIEVSEKDKEVVSYYVKLAKELGFAVSTRQEKDRASHRIVLNSVALVELAKSLGLDARSTNRRAPLELFHATDEEIREFIAGFYDAEGARIKGNRSFPRMFSTSKELLKDIQILLLYFGINSFLEKRVRSVRLPQGKVLERHKIYELAILDHEDIKKFSNAIPTLKPMARGRVKKRRSSDVIPISSIVAQIYERRVKSGERVTKKKTRLTLSKYINKNPSRRALAELLEIIEGEPEAEYLRKLVDGNVRWLKVSRIERSGGYSKYFEEKEVGVSRFLVYDFEVPQYRTLITDGIISHNSRVTHLVDAGVPVETVSKVLARHANVSTTAGFYLGVTERMKASIPPAGEVLRMGGGRGARRG